MNMAMEIGVYGGAIPFAIAIALVYLSRRVASQHVFERFAMATALAVAFFVAWILLPDDWTPLKPTRPRHWLPYLGLLAAVLSACGPGGVRRNLSYYAWRWSTIALTAAASALLLAPNWPALEPPRYVYVSVLAGYQFTLMTLLDALPERLLGRIFPFLLFAAASATSLVITEPLSLQYGQIAGVTAAALLGCSVATWHGISGGALRALIPGYAVLVGGFAFTSSIEPDPPIYSILLAPLAPLMLWLCAYGPLARLTGWKAVAVQIAVVLLPLAVLVAWTLLGGEPEYGEYEYPEWDY